MADKSEFAIDKLANADEWATPEINISYEACAMACMIVSNPGGVMRKDGDGWQRRVNDLIRALRTRLTECEAQLKAIGTRSKGVRDGDRATPCKPER